MIWDTYTYTFKTLVIFPFDKSVKQVITEVNFSLDLWIFDSFVQNTSAGVGAYFRMASIDVFPYYTLQRISQFPCRLKGNSIISLSDLDQSFMINWTLGNFLAIAHV